MHPLSARARLALAIEHPLLQQGGVEVLVRQLIPPLAEHYDLVMVTGDRDMAALGEFARYVTAHYSWSADDATPASAQKLAADLKAGGVDLIHFHGAEYEWHSARLRRSPIFHAARAGLPCLMTDHLTHPLLEGYCLPERPTWQKLLLLPRTWLNKAVVMGSLRAEIMVSKRDQSRLRSYFPLQAGKIHRVYHSRLTGDMRGLPMDQREKTIVCLAAICERKNQVGLTRAFGAVAGKFPDWTLQFVGRCETEETLTEVREIAARAGISDRVVVRPPRDNPDSLLAGAAIFALPSLREGLPLSLQEALYYGCACVASHLDGVAEMVENERIGLLVTPGDDNGLATALARLMSDEPLRTRLGQEGRQAILDKGMSAEAMIETHLRIYEAVLTGKDLSAILT